MDTTTTDKPNKGKYIPTKVWEELKGHPNYEICLQYPYDVREKSTGKVLNEPYDEDDGYYYIKIDGRDYLKHMIIAKQWIPNDDPERDHIEHINGNKADDHIQNLCWSVPKHYREHVKDLPPFTIRVDHYDDIDGIEDLYFCDDVFYVFKGIDYNVIKKRQDHNGFWFSIITLPDGYKIKISYVAFKHEYDWIQG